MKILQVTPRYPPQPGGVETHVQEISERLVERGHEVTVMTADAGYGGERRERRNGVSVQRYRSIAPNDAIYVCPQIAAAVRRSDADVVHAHNYHSFPLFFAARGVGDRHFVVTTHYHGGSASSLRDHLLSLYRPFGRWAVRRANEVIAVSEWEREQLAADFCIDATVIPNGLKQSRFREASPESRSCPYVLSVGRLEEYKHVQDIIQTLPALPEYELVVAGTGPYRDSLERSACTAGVAERVSFLGYVSEERLPQLYAGATVAVNLSEFESYGLTVGEALAAGTPVVVRAANGLDHWTSADGCVGITDVNPVTVAEAIKRATQQSTTSMPPDWDNVVTAIEDKYDI